MAIPPALEEKSGSKSAGYRLWRDRILRISAAVLVTVVLANVPFDTIEAVLYDLRVRITPDKKTSGKVELVMIKSSTITRFRGLPGFKEHAEALATISKAKPQAVIFLRRFAPFKGNESQYSEEYRKGLFSGNEKDKAKFMSAVAGIPNFYLQTDFMEQAGEIGKLKLVPPFEATHIGSGPKTSDRTVLGKDGVSRRLLVTYQEQPLLHLKVARLFNPDLENSTSIRGKFDLFDSEQVYIDFHRPGVFAQTLFEDLHDGKVDPSRFTGKLVLIGDDTGSQARDYVSTPLEHEQLLPVAELHANMFDSLIRNNSPVLVQKYWDWIFTFLISSITIFVVMASRPARGIVIMLSTTAGFLILGELLFWLFGLWVPMAHSLCAIFLCYYFLIPYRLIVENRRSWEYYQKNRLLHQVEELKTNFISMMSHDLKTPIARIQGMTDIISKDAVKLSSHQIEALDTIRSSSSDLLGFISAILNYARIESQGVELHKEGKDINQLLQEVILRHEFLAKLKGMKITSDLEPLFSISVDADLIRQVFSNLLENAIKYSPEKSAITVRSREVDGMVRVEFQDEGQGIDQDDLNHIFMKFFRSKNAKISPIKGSGLGLYLTKYFVELHKGRVFVTSTLGKGSCFTVDLPLNSAVN